HGNSTILQRRWSCQSSNYAGAITRFIRLGLEGMPPIIFDDGEQTRDFVFVGDAVRATVASLRKPLPGGTVLNVGTGKPTSIKLLAEQVLGTLKLYPVHTACAAGSLGDVRKREA